MWTFHHFIHIGFYVSVYLSIYLSIHTTTKESMNQSLKQTKINYNQPNYKHARKQRTNTHRRSCESRQSEHVEAADLEQTAAAWSLEAAAAAEGEGGGGEAERMKG